MTERYKQTGARTDDLADPPPGSDAERAESAWLLARDHDPFAPAPSPQIAGEYGEIEDLLRTLPPGPDDGWQAEVLRAASALAPSSRPRRRASRVLWGMGGAIAAVAVVVVVVLHPRPAGDELDVAIRHVDKTRGDSGQVVIGDQLIVRAPAAPDERDPRDPRAQRALRVFRSGAPVAWCPGGPGCTTAHDGAQVIDLTLDAPVRYQVLLVVGMPQRPRDDTLEAYLDAARAANARIVAHEPIDVH